MYARETSVFVQSRKDLLTSTSVTKRPKKGKGVRYRENIQHTWVDLGERIESNQHQRMIEERKAVPSDVWLWKASLEMQMRS